MSQWEVKYQYMPRPVASAEAWVYEIHHNGQYRGTLVDERVRYKTLFEPGKDRHDDLDEFIIPLDGRYWVQSGKWSRTLVPGEATLIPKSTDHDSGTATNLVGRHFLVLLFNPKLGILKNSKAGGIALPPGSLFWLKGAFRFLRSQPNVGKEPGYRNQNMASFDFEHASLVFDQSDEDTTLTLALKSIDCDLDFSEIKSRGAQVVEPPSDQPWGVRTAYFQGPGRMMIEIEQPHK